MEIYRITNNVDGKIYIGQTIQPFESRKYEHIKRVRLGDERPLYCAIRKYGIDSFSFKVIDTAETQEELNQKEKYWIAHYNSRVPNGYNLTDGGHGTFGYHHTSEDKDRMRELKNGMYLGKDNPFYGKHHSPEQIAKWKEQRKDRRLTEEWKANISKTRIRKPVIDIDTGIVYASARDAARAFGKDPDGGSSASIAYVCKKRPRHKTFCGHRFEYYQPEEQGNTVPSASDGEGVTTIP